MTQARAAVRAGARAGFTLVEVVLSMAILALVAGLALPRVLPGTSATDLRADAFRIAALLRSDRNAAVVSGKAVSTFVDPASASAISGDTRRSVTLSGGVSLGVTAPLPGQFVFYPDGRSSGGAVTLSRRGIVLTVRVEPVTAAVAIVAQ